MLKVYLHVNRLVIYILFHFSAIQFVLSADEFSNLRQEERQALLHVSHFMSWYWDVNLYFFCYGSPGSNLLHVILGKTLLFLASVMKRWIEVQQ